MTAARTPGPLSPYTVFPCLLAIPLLISFSVARAASREEYRYDVLIGGIPAGTVRDVWEETTVGGACVVRFASEMRISLPRGGSELAMGTRSIAEADCGTYRPRSLRVERDEGGGASVTTAKREGDRLVVTTEKGGLTEKTSVALAKDAVFFGMLFRKYPNDFFLGKGSVAAISEEGVTERTITFDGRRAGDTLEVAVSYEGVRLLFALRGPVVLSTNIGGGLIVYRLHTGDGTKTAPADAPAADILALTAISNNGVRVARPRAARRLTLQVTAKDGGDLPVSCVQSGVANGDGTRTVTVDIAKAPCRGPFGPADTAATLYEDKDHPAVARIAAQWKGVNDRDRLLREVTLFVHRYITDKNYRHGTLSASETIAARAGDCTEHAVLATALLRALGVPARVVYGLVLANDGRFFFHHWIEAHTGTGWIPADPTFGIAPADAARLVVARGTGGGMTEREDFSLAVMRFLQGTRLAVTGISYE